MSCAVMGRAYAPGVGMLVLLNGPPASGKSTIAARLVAARPLALRLDVDVVRSLLGAWIDQPNDAGLAAQELAVSMARTHRVGGSSSDDSLGEMFDRHEEVLRSRMRAHRVDVTDDDVDGTVDGVEVVLARFGGRGAGGRA